MQQYRVTSPPKGAMCDADYLKVGDVVTLERSTPDPDGDVLVNERPEDRAGFVLMSCLTLLAEGEDAATVDAPVPFVPDVLTVDAFERAWRALNTADDSGCLSLATVVSVARALDDAKAGV